MYDALCEDPLVKKVNRRIAKMAEDSPNTVRRRLLFAGAVLVGNADGRMAAEEVEIFEQFFGSGAFSDDFDLEALEASLDERIGQVRG